MKITHAFDHFSIHMRARSLSQRTIDSYQMACNLLVRHLGDLDAAQITRADLLSFFADQATGKSPRTVWTYHVALSAFYTWLAAEQYADNLMTTIPRPKFHPKEINPYTQAEINALLGAVRDHGTENRNRAILLLLLDTGLRASELVDLLKPDVDYKGMTVHVRMGKGNKSRMVPFSPATAEALRRWTANTVDYPDTPLFITEEGNPFNRAYLLTVIKRIGKRAGVAGANCHRFRHTFAIQFLRTNPDVFALQRMLGHSSLETVQVYLALAQTDIEKAHRIGSPVKNWKL